MISSRLIIIMLLSVAAHAHAADNRQQELYQQLEWAIIENAPLEERQEFMKDAVAIKNDFGQTLCHLAAAWNRRDAIDRLIQNGADVSPNDLDKDTPLHDACHFNSLEAARALLEHGANTEVKNDRGKTPLDIAREKGLQEIVKLIEEYQAIPDIKEPEGT